MNSKTTIIPSMMRTEGSKQIQVSEDFDTAIKNLYNLLDDLVYSGYVSPESLAIKENIDEYKGTLINAKNTIRGYGEFLIGAANDTEENSQDIIQKTKINY